MKRFTYVLLGVVMVLAGYGSAHAFGGYLDTFNTQYPVAQYPNVNNIKNCGLCHVDPNGGGSRNSYGTAFANGHSYSTIDGLDSDGDGFTNHAEITNNPPTYPGSASSHPAPAPVTCTSFTYSAYGACQSDSTQSRTVLTSSPAGCTGGSPVLTQACIYTPPAITCTSFTYSEWGACQANSTQTRTITSSLPANCSGGSPAPLTQSCTYTPPAGNTSVTVTAAEGSGNITVETLTGGATLTNVSAISSSAGSISQSGKPSGFTFNNGLVTFKLNGVATGGTGRVKITFPSNFSSGSEVYKVNATGFHKADAAVASIAGNVVTLVLTDGGSSDSDGTANGSITDPVGVASPVSNGGGDSDGDGGGGCSVGPRAGSATALADAAVILSPLLVLAAARLLRRRKVSAEQ